MISKTFDELDAERELTTIFSASDEIAGDALFAKLHEQSWMGLGINIAIGRAMLDMKWRLGRVQIAARFGNMREFLIESD